MAPTKTKLRVKKKDGGGKSSQRLLANASPNSKCPICLDSFKNVASLDRCLHQFCFPCIHEWSKNKAECPLCKQPFHSIFHSVKGENDFKEFVLRPLENGAPPAGDPPGRVLRGRERRSHRLQQPVPFASSPLDDVMFGGLSDAAAGNQDVQQMVIRLTARRSGRGEGRSLRHLRDQDVVAFRRALYRTGVRVRNTRDGSRQRDISAAFLRQNPPCLRRLLPWLQRELTVLYGSHGSLVSIVQHIIMSRVTDYNMEESAIRDELRPFLLARTDHFLHELVSFARSTLSMEAYDQQAIYDCPAPSYEEGSSSDSSVIAISEDDDNASDDDVTANPSVLQEQAPPAPPATASDSLPSESAWDDETPGPSYSTLLLSSSHSQDEGPEPSGSTDAPLEQTAPAASVSGGPRADEDEEECLIVGYVKPMAERTPELVQLSSDSSEEEQEANATDTKATVLKAEGSQSHVNQRSPASSPGPAPPSSPQLTRLDSHTQRSRSRERTSRSRSPSSRDRHAHRHRSRDGFELIRKDLLHQHSDTKEHCETWEPSHHTESQDGSWSDHSPMSIWSSSEASPSRHGTSSDRERSQPVTDRFSHSSWDEDRGRRRRRSRSPDSDSFIGSQCPGGRSRESRRSRKRKRRSIISSSSSSSADSRSERCRLDKPSGKRKYKTRHLERAAQRQHGEGSTSAEKRPGRRERKRGRELRLSRSPSVEIVFERKASDSHVHQRKKRRHRKRKREQRSPTIITIDSDSDRTIDCLDRVLDVIDQTAAGLDDEQNETGNTVNTTSNSLLELSSSPVRTLNLDDCVVDVVNHKTDTNTQSVPDPVTAIPPPSDTRLLESILQDLEDFLPGVLEEAAAAAGSNRRNPLTQTVSLRHDQTNMTEESERLKNTTAHSDVEQDNDTH